MAYQNRSVLVEDLLKPISNDAIANRAFDLWEKAGQPRGMALELWTQAEKELREEQQECARHLSSKVAATY